jgi:hypothetical protein
MKNFCILLFACLLLAGCKDDAVPVKMKFPEAVQDLMAACPDLKKVDESTDKLSVILYAVSDNYATYYECKAKVDAWIEWYKNQKDAFDQTWK